MTSILALGIRAAALFVAVLALGGRSRPAVVGLVVLALVVWRLARLPELAEGRRLWRNSTDPAFQGDGWHWTLCLLLPNWLLWSSPMRNDRWASTPVRAPFTLDMLVLTRVQRRACIVEFWETRALEARLGRPLERWETIEREEPNA